MFSRRVPDSGAPNPWFERLEALRSRGVPLHDLTETSPTRVGLAELDDATATMLAEAAREPYVPDPRGLPAARAAVAAYHAGRGDRVEAGQLVLTTGASESVAHLLRLLCEPGDSVLVPSPGYPLFSPIAAAEGVRAEPWRLVWEGRWAMDLASVERGLAAGARAVCVVEPNHPTGSRLAPGEWEALEALCVRHGAAIVADEVFADHGWDPARPRFASRAGERAALTFTLGGLSKTCGFPQLKLGWISVSGPAPDRERALAGLEWLADLTLSVSGPVQHAAAALLAHADTFRARTHARIRSNLASLDAFATRHPGLERLPGEGGWTALLRLPVDRDDEGWVLALLDRGVVLHPGHFYDLEDGPIVVPSLVVEEPVLRAALVRAGELFGS